MKSPPHFDADGHLARFRNRIARYAYQNWTLSVHTRLDIDVTEADCYVAGRAGFVPVITREHLWLCAAARVLRARPLFNASFDGFGTLAARDRIDLRVSFKTAEGLRFGVIEHADHLDPAGMARAYTAAAARARPPEEVREPPPVHSGVVGRLRDDLAATIGDLVPYAERLVGIRSGADEGTFTVINAGAWGAEDYHAVLLRPATAMMIVMKPREEVVRTPAGPALTVKVPVAVPFCHKIMDTDAAGYFLFHLQEILKTPASLGDATQGMSG
jgi:pyruvate/2-oxoglutarate dehydrogenase complex dihydrolipoamide acyltransferase (E2) component